MSNTQRKLTSSPQEGAPGHCWQAQIFDAEGSSIACLDSTADPAVASDRARRLVACWNACDGIETYALELMTGDLSIESQLKPAFKPVKVETSLAVKRRHEIKALRAVNAELLEALENIVDGSGSSYRELFIQARAAIASARKQENHHG